MAVFAAVADWRAAPRWVMFNVAGVFQFCGVVQVHAMGHVRTAALSIGEAREALHVVSR
jgi:hypothetical protein